MYIDRKQKVFNKRENWQSNLQTYIILIKINLVLNLLHIVFNTRLEIISKQNIPWLQNYQFYTLQNFKQ